MVDKQQQQASTQHQQKMQSAPGPAKSSLDWALGSTDPGPGLFPLLLMSGATRKDPCVARFLTCVALGRVLTGGSQGVGDGECAAWGRRGSVVLVIRRTHMATCPNKV